jgi:hypothetical protein
MREKIASCSSERGRDGGRGVMSRKKSKWGSWNSRRRGGGSWSFLGWLFATSPREGEMSLVSAEGTSVEAFISMGAGGGFTFEIPDAAEDEGASVGDDGAVFES